MRITSPHNPVVKYVRSLERATSRREHGVFVIEGTRLLREAIASRPRVPLVLHDPELLQRSDAGISLLYALPEWAERVYEVDERVLSHAAQTETPAGIIAVVPIPAEQPLVSHRSDRFGLILDRLADPGNAGSILRTADALGVTYVLAVPETVDLFSPKVVRAGMGAHFHLDLYRDISWQVICESLEGVAFVATDVGAGDSLHDFTWPERAALIVSNEAHGISHEAQLRARSLVRIPMREAVESLNAAAAAAILLYDALGPSVDSEG